MKNINISGCIMAQMSSHMIRSTIITASSTMLTDTSTIVQINKSFR